MFVRVNITLIIVVIIAAIILLYVIKRILQGRHRNSEYGMEKENKNSSSICVNISNTNNTRSKSGDYTTSNYTNAKAELKGIINKHENS